MNILLDTHVLIWLDLEPEKLSPSAKKILADTENMLFLSVVSVWEMQIKSQIGKLSHSKALSEVIQEQRKINRIQILSVELPHVLKVGELPLHHRDPFDRLLIAQALVEDMTILSKDAVFQQYNANVIW